MAGPSDPELVTNEEVYLKLQNAEVTFEDHSNSKKIKKGNILLTTHRFIFYIAQDGLEIPLYNVGEIEKLGGLFKTDGIKLHLTNHNQLPPYVIEYTKKILKSNQMPQPLSLPGAVSFRFHDKTRDKCLELLNESFNRKHWNKPILTEAEE
jgi:hypothetical protein